MTFFFICKHCKCCTCMWDKSMQQKLNWRTATVRACKCERKRALRLRKDISGIIVRESKKLFKAVKTTTQWMLLTDCDRFTASTQNTYEKWWNIHMLHSALKPFHLIKGDTGNTNWSSDLNWITERLSAIIWTGQNIKAHKWEDFDRCSLSTLSNLLPINSSLCWVPKGNWLRQSNQRVWVWHFRNLYSPYEIHYSRFSKKVKLGLDMETSQKTLL